MKEVVGIKFFVNKMLTLYLTAMIHCACKEE